MPFNPLKRSQIGRGTFEVFQNAIALPSAWVASDGALNEERWIWIAKARATGDSDRELEMAVISPPAGSQWTFSKVLNSGESAADLILRARASAPAADYDLIGRIHTKATMPGLP